MEITIIILLVLLFFSSVGIIAFLYHIKTALQLESKQLKSSVQKLEGELKYVKRELSSINAKIGELTEVDKME